MSDLPTFSLIKKIKRGQVDKRIFIKKSSHDILLVKAYVDDIIFFSTNKSIFEDFVRRM